jgi:hypothetical protein
VSRVRLTTPATHNRLETIIANPIQAIILLPLTRNASGLHVDEIQLSLLNHRLMNPLAVLACSIAPTGHRPFIQSKRMHDGLDRTPIGEEGHNLDNEVRRLAESFQHRPSSRTECLFTAATAIALPFAIMDTNIALPSLASCRTRHVRAK